MPLPSLQGHQTNRRQYQTEQTPDKNIGKKKQKNTHTQEEAAQRCGKTKKKHAASSPLAALTVLNQEVYHAPCVIPTVTSEAAHNRKKSSFAFRNCTLRLTTLSLIHI